MAQAEEVDVILAWRNDPVLFVEQVFQVVPEPWQKKALVEIAVHDRVSIRSGHGVGKSAFLSWVIYWWLLTNVSCKAACTAPTSHQLSDVLWGELAKWARMMPKGLRSLVDLSQDMVTRKDAPKEAFCVARTARKETPEAFQGFHSEAMLFIIDEASGVDDVIFEVGEGAMSTPGAKTLMVGNPTRTSGYFFDSHHRMRSAWSIMRVSCLDKEMVSGRFQSDTYSKNMALRYGEDSNIYRVRVLGEFPSHEDDVVIPLNLVEASVGRDVECAEGRIIWGLDVARFGDDRTALTKRKKNWLLEKPKTWRNKDTMQTAGMVVHEFENTQHDMRPDRIMVDSIGVGAGVVDALKEHGLPVKGVNVSESPAVASNYMRLRDELYWKAREWFEDKASKLPVGCDELIAELTIPKYQVQPNGKIKVESKQEIKRRIPNSPDIADSFMLTFATNDRKLSYWATPVRDDLDRFL